ncbi:Gfo/Idh/MocA family protein [Flavihumibacter petaseus]|uniref:Gfo/Idh/MocA-like oxidoreductase N-terminal domain-containing protein n=1 Tax=Flavihumibacter petaseus NBRC 106054 TaxID=1220578 RepID=A0A0E9MUU1_9BACT|nr:Gfo/Idh/MocA family oxidoreductase [Flavihumibacter petaseus]GAO41196.1 hypothetical protein FPE01S_01_02080 [Flavihumibacter petaseus NBRC 106054]
MSKAVQFLLRHYRQFTGNSFLKQIPANNPPLAIIGAGHHATGTLYPCLWHLGANVQLICTRHMETAHAAAARWPGCKGTTRLEDILENKLIIGVIVCTEPKAHADIVSRLLAAGKHVYVEKPLGYSGRDLEQVLSANTGSTIMAGLQRNYSPIANKLQNLVKSPLNYHYRFEVGRYPDGNAVFELFIHPVALIVHLFGRADILSITVNSADQRQLLQLQLRHEKVSGLLELSTAGNWENCCEILTVNDSAGKITASYPNELMLTETPGSIAGIPEEKVFATAAVTRQYLFPNNFNTAIQFNSLFQSGFYTALQVFLQNCNGNKAQPAEVEKLRLIYQLLDRIQESVTSR